MNAGVAPLACSRSGPLITEVAPPVTRLTTLASDGIVVTNVADWPELMLKVPKLKKILCPDWRPSVCGIEKFGPVRDTAAPSDPSVRICARHCVAANATMHAATR